MKAKEYLQKAIIEGITNPIIFRGYNHAWESKELTITQAIELLDTDFLPESKLDIQLSQSGIDTDFSKCLIVYFLD